MDIWLRKNALQVGLDLRVPDETLSRDTKPLVDGDQNTHAFSAKGAEDVALSRRLKREAEQGG